MNPADREPAEPTPNPGKPSFEQIIDACLDDSGTGQASAQLAEALATSPDRLADYLDQVQMHALLQWRNGQIRLAIPEGLADDAIRNTAGVSPMRIGPARLSRFPLRIAAAVVVAASLVGLLASHFLRSRSASQVTAVSIGTVVETRDAIWPAGQQPMTAGQTIRPGDIGLESGSITLRLSSGATATLTGRSRITLVSNMRIKTALGRLTVHVDPSAHGFAVEAPNAEVIDLGTEFGVQVAEAGPTDVVVFEGKVDLNRPALATPASQPAATRPATTQLVKGEGIRVGLSGVLERIVAVNRQPGKAEWSVNGEATDRVIAAVSDNLRAPTDKKYYQIVRKGLAEDVPAYVDRSYEWNGPSDAGLPPDLVGSDLVMTFNSDKRTPGLEISVSIARPALLFVFLQADADPPAWLKKDFTKTEMKIGLDEGPPDMPRLRLDKGPGQSIDRFFNVWIREVKEAGVVKLGENADTKSMYGIAAKAIN